MAALVSNAGSRGMGNPSRACLLAESGHGRVWARPTCEAGTFRWIHSHLQKSNDPAVAQGLANADSSDAPCWSFADRIGGRFSGHSMASGGSLQRMLRSSSGT